MLTIPGKPPEPPHSTARPTSTPAAILGTELPIPSTRSAIPASGRQIPSTLGSAITPVSSTPSTPFPAPATISPLRPVVPAFRPQATGTTPLVTTRATDSGADFTTEALITAATFETGSLRTALLGADIGPIHRPQGPVIQIRPMGRALGTVGRPGRQTIFATPATASGTIAEFRAFPRRTGTFAQTAGTLVFRTTRAPGLSAAPRETALLAAAVPRAIPAALATQPALVVRGGAVPAGFGSDLTGFRGGLVVSRTAVLPDLARTAVLPGAAFGKAWTGVAVRLGIGIGAFRLGEGPGGAQGESEGEDDEFQCVFHGSLICLPVLWLAPSCTLGFPGQGSGPAAGASSFRDD